jgi:hypothetical protein
VTATFDYEQEPYAPFADGGQPLYFKRRYGGNPQPDREIDGILHVDMSPAQAIWIYGYSVTSRYAEDKPQERFAWNERGSFLTWCYSVMEPRGEPGFVPLAEVQEITREEFEAAAAAKWRD